MHRCQPPPHGTQLSWRPQRFSPSLRLTGSLGCTFWADPGEVAHHSFSSGRLRSRMILSHDPGLDFRLTHQQHCCVWDMLTASSVTAQNWNSVPRWGLPFCHRVTWTVPFWSGPGICLCGQSLGARWLGWWGTQIQYTLRLVLFKKKNCYKCFLTSAPHGKLKNCIFVQWVPFGPLNSHTLSKLFLNWMSILYTGPRYSLTLLCWQLLPSIQGLSFCDL